jgi:hypothetical protein
MHAMLGSTSVALLGCLLSSTSALLSLPPMHTHATHRHDVRVCLKCDDGDHRHHHEQYYEQQPRLYPASDIGMRGGSVGGPDGGTAKRPLPSPHFPQGGPYDTWEAAAAFSANRLDWVYTWNATTIAAAHRLGLTFTSTINANLPDPGTGMLGAPTNSFTVGRCENIEGKPLTAPWMRGWSPSSPATGPAWGCINNPEYREVAYEFTQRVLEARPDALQHDDPELNAGMVAWDHGNPETSGCYCEHCMANFTRSLKISLNASEQQRLQLETFNYKTFIKGGSAAHSRADVTMLRQLFVDFQTNSTIGWLTDLKAYINRLAARLKLPSPLPFSANNNGVWSETYMMFDLAIGELSQLSSNPKGLRQILVTHVPPGKQTVLTMPKWNNATFAYLPQGIANIRWAIAYAYSSGGNMLAPWDNYLPSSTERFYGDRAQFGDLFAFIRQNPQLFDNKTELLDPPLPNYQLVHSNPGDSYRWNLPEPNGEGGNVTSFIDPSLPKCQAACDGFPGCKGIFWSEDDGSVGTLCALLTRLTTTFTHMLGQSYIRNATATSPHSALLAATATPEVSVLPRRSEHQIVVHIVDWRVGNPLNNGCTSRGLNAPMCTGPMHHDYASIEIALDNLRVSGRAACGSFAITLGGPGRTPAKTLAPTSCLDGRTVVTIPAARPWVVLILSNRSTARATLKGDDATSPDPRWHDLEFGANIGYAGGPAATTAVIRRAASEGTITQLRAFEPWPAGSAGAPHRWAPSRAPEVAAGWMAAILNVHPAVSLLMSLSNYPYRTPADLGADPAKYLAAWPNSSAVRGWLTGMLAYTNRAALFAAEGASAGDYAAKLAQLRSNLTSLGLLKRIRWEIGNEADAPSAEGSSMYFWGTATQFNEVAQVAYQQLHEEGPLPILCCGYAGYGRPRAWAGPIGGAFEEFASGAQARYPGTRLSWHLYLNGGENTYDGVQARAKRSQTPDVLNGSSITEFGLRSNGNAVQLSVLQTPQLVTEMVRLLAFCYATGVSSVYYESLMDHPRKHGEYMGLFDRWGQSKLSYSYLRLIKTVIDGGYRTSNSSSLLEIIGRVSNRTLALAHANGDAALPLDGNTSVVAASSARGYDGIRLQAGEWVVVCHSM